MVTDVITLLTEIEEVDEYGDIDLRHEERDVFARRVRIDVKDELEARSRGFSHQIRFMLTDYWDYEDEEELRYQGKVYRIISAQVVGTALELSCVRGVMGEREGREGHDEADHQAISGHEDPQRRSEL